MYDGLDIEAVGVLGDDRVTIGHKLPRNRCHIPSVMEIDEVATHNRIILGMCLVPTSSGEHFGTYPGTIRVSVDRGAKAQPFNLGEWVNDIGNTMTDDSFKIYLEMASHGTIHGEPLIDFISTIDDEDFWDQYSNDRYKYFGVLANEENRNKGSEGSGDPRRGRESYQLERSGRYGRDSINRDIGKERQDSFYAWKTRFYNR
jgi:hypothetical protein